MKGWEGLTQRGGADVGRLETRVDEYLSPQAKKLALQVSKAGLLCCRCKGLVLMEFAVHSVNIVMHDL
jgi:hypothetical protein